MIHIYDGNNHARVVWETDSTGQPLRNLLAETNAHQTPVVWVFDGQDANSLRRKIYPEYKQRRVSAPDDFYKSIQLLREALMHTSAMQVVVPGYEADDTIATLAIGLQEKHQVMIHSTDGDFQALRVFPNIMTSRQEYKQVENVSQIRLYKTVVGDKSDNIPGIPGFGDKAWEKVNKQALHDYLMLKDTDDFITNMRRLIQSMNVSPGVARWLADPVSHRQLQVYYQVAGFFSVPDELITKYTVFGQFNRDLQELVLKRIMQ